MLSLQRYGLHFFSAAVGCPVREVGDQVWCDPLTQSGQRLEDFVRPNLDENAVVAEAIDLLRFLFDATEGRLPIEDILTHWLPLDQFKEGIDLANDGSQSIKVVLDPKVS